MKKVLFVATVAGHITSFHIPYLKWFKDKGFCVDVVSSGERDIPNSDNYFKLPFARNPLSKANISVYKKLKEIINEGNYSIIHCHTPVAGILTRLASRKVRKKGTKVIYTAHGFHFFKGAPKINWLIYHPIEWLFSFFTDVLITINKEDYRFAKKHLHAKKIEYVPGVGVNKQKFCGESEKSKQEMFGVSDEKIVLFSVGELNKNKNHETILRAIKRLDNKDIHYYIAGKGKYSKYLTDLGNELGIAKNFHLMGIRYDINDLLSNADIFCFPSFREGLPVSVMEAMSAGLVCVVSKIRGNVDLIQDGKGGYLCTPSNPDEFAQSLEKLIIDEKTRYEMGCFNKEESNKYSIETVISKMVEIYESLL